MKRGFLWIFIMSERHLRLGVNIDHVATLRNARGEAWPDPLRAAQMALDAGADGITVHLREDRRHIMDDDIIRLRQLCPLPMNLEMAATDEMLAIACDVKPPHVCIVPEKREEITTEGGLDVIGGDNHLQYYVSRLVDEGIRVSLFVDPDPQQISAAKRIGAQTVEIHTGSFCKAYGTDKSDEELQKVIVAANAAHDQGLECHAGHGLTFDNVEPIAAINVISELNIGHFLISEAVFVGLDVAIKKMRKAMDAARGMECSA